MRDTPVANHRLPVTDWYQQLTTDYNLPARDPDIYIYIDISRQVERRQCLPASLTKTGRVSSFSESRLDRSFGSRIRLQERVTSSGSKCPSVNNTAHRLTDSTVLQSSGLCPGSRAQISKNLPCARAPVSVPRSYTILLYYSMHCAPTGLATHACAKYSIQYPVKHRMISDHRAPVRRLV